MREISKIDIKIHVKDRLSHAKILRADAVRMQNEAAQIEVEMDRLVGEFEIDIEKDD